MDILDLYSDGSLECCELQNVRSEEELRRWTTDESLSETSKATLLLSRGFVLQKTAILNNLPRLVNEPDLASVLEVLSREVPGWDESLQIEAGNGLIALVARTSLPEPLQEALLRVTLELLATWSESVHAVWVTVFASLVPQTSLDVIRKLCVSAVVRLAEFAQPISTRLLATRLIGVMAKRLSGEFRGDLLQKALMLAQDTQYEIRRSMCTEMKGVCRAVPVELRPRALDEVLQLANDEEIEVKCEALSSLVEILDLLPADCVKEQVVPLIYSCLFDSPDPQLKFQTTQICGKILVQITAHFHDEVFLQDFLRYFQSLCASENESDRKAAAFQFPGVISAIGEAEFVKNLIESYEALTHDRVEEVRSMMAASLHEVAKLLPGEAVAMSDIFGKFLADKKTAPVVIRGLSELLPLLAPVLESSQILSQLTSLLTSLSWRLSDCLLSQLQTNLSLFRLSDVLDTLQPALLSLFSKVCLPLKVRIVHMLAEITHINFMSELRHELCTSVLLLLSKSRRYWDRILFVEFCVKILSLNSRKFFHKFFYAPLLRMTQDSVRNVRLKIALHLAMLQAQFFAEEEMHNGIAEAIVWMMKDQDSEVARLATEAHCLSQQANYWTSIQAIETQEREKLAHEERQAQQEIREREEAKKRLVQELTEKARMDYLQQYKDKKNAASKTPKPGLKGSATSARLPPIKTKVEGQKSSSANTSPKLASSTSQVKLTSMKTLPARKK